MEGEIDDGESKSRKNQLVKIIHKRFFFGKFPPKDIVKKRRVFIFKYILREILIFLKK